MMETGLGRGIITTQRQTYAAILHHWNPMKVPQQLCFWKCKDEKTNFISAVGISCSPRLVVNQFMHSWVGDGSRRRFIAHFTMIIMFDLSKHGMIVSDSECNIHPLIHIIPSTHWSTIGFPTALENLCPLFFYQPFLGQSNQKEYFIWTDKDSGGFRFFSQSHTSLPIWIHDNPATTSRKFPPKVGT